MLISKRTIEKVEVPTPTSLNPSHIYLQGQNIFTLYLTLAFSGPAGSCSWKTKTKSSLSYMKAHKFDSSTHSVLNKNLPLLSNISHLSEQVKGMENAAQIVFQCNYVFEKNQPTVICDMRPIVTTSQVAALHKYVSLTKSY